MTTWSEIKPGDTITVHKTYNRRAHKIRVAIVELTSDKGKYALVTGERLQLSGGRSGLRGQIELDPGQRVEFVHIDEVTLVEQAV